VRERPSPWVDRSTVQHSRTCQFGFMGPLETNPTLCHPCLGPLGSFTGADIATRWVPLTGSRALAQIRPRAALSEKQTRR
jgi:hypothetical protein